MNLLRKYVIGSHIQENFQLNNNEYYFIYYKNNEWFINICCCINII
jgi:hypothetical protein